MNTEQITNYVMRYLEATECRIEEKNPVYATVKLSEQADRALTDRPYYWNFVDRTGAEAETMRFTFVFDPTAMPPERGPVSFVSSPAAAPPVPQTTSQEAKAYQQDQTIPSDSIMHRYFGVAPAFTGGGGGIGRIPKEDVHFGSRRLEQIMGAACLHGRFVSLFDQGPLPAASDSSAVRRSQYSRAYEPWLMLNLKLEFACDLKRQEIHSFGISCISGQVMDSFMERIQQRNLSPKLPPHIHTMAWIYTIEQAVELAGQAVRLHVNKLDLDWAVDASERLEDEMARLASYYEPLLDREAEERLDTTYSEEDKQQSMMSLREQYEMRQNELRWQFEPRIQVQLINAALLYLPFGEPIAASSP